MHAKRARENNSDNYNSFDSSWDNDSSNENDDEELWVQVMISSLLVVASPTGVEVLQEDSLLEDVPPVVILLVGIYRQTRRLKTRYVKGFFVNRNRRDFLMMQICYRSSWQEVNGFAGLFSSCFSLRYLRSDASCTLIGPNRFLAGLAVYSTWRLWARLSIWRRKRPTDTLCSREWQRVWSGEGWW